MGIQMFGDNAVLFLIFRADSPFELIEPVWVGPELCLPSAWCAIIQNPLPPEITIHDGKLHFRGPFLTLGQVRRLEARVKEILDYENSDALTPWQRTCFNAAEVSETAVHVCNGLDPVFHLIQLATQIAHLGGAFENIRPADRFTQRMRIESFCRSERWWSLYRRAMMEAKCWADAAAAIRFTYRIKQSLVRFFDGFCNDYDATNHAAESSREVYLAVREFYAYLADRRMAPSIIRRAFEGPKTLVGSGDLRREQAPATVAPHSPPAPTTPDSSFKATAANANSAEPSEAFGDLLDWVPMITVKTAKYGRKSNSTTTHAKKFVETRSVRTRQIAGAWHAHYGDLITKAFTGRARDEIVAWRESQCSRSQHVQ